MKKCTSNFVKLFKFDQLYKKKVSTYVGKLVCYETTFREGSNLVS
jgi:hypothetical protein